jgi:hypothetical protein
MANYKTKLILIGTIVVTVICVFESALLAQSSKKMEVKLTHSWLFITSDVLYPGGIADAGSYPTISESQYPLLERRLSQDFDHIAELHARNALRVGNYMHKTLPKTVAGVVKIDNLRLPIAKSFINETGHLEIRIDIRVLQAAFRASLASIMREDTLFDKEKSDDELLSEFFKQKAELTATKGRSSVGDLIDVIKSRDDTALERVMDFWGTKSDVQPTYEGALLFFIAHEVGHYVLGHHTEACAASCESFEARELEADKYAGYLLGSLISPFGEMASNYSEILGYEVFFEDAYTRVGFEDPGDSACHCSYPDPKKREDGAAEAAGEAVQEYAELLEKDPKAARDTTPVTVRVRGSHSHIKSPHWLIEWYLP